MDREVRQHLLRPQLGSRKRKAEFTFPESRTKMSRLQMMSNYLNPMSGLVHRHTPYKLPPTLAGRMEIAMMLNNSLQRHPYTNNGSNHTPLSRIPALTHLPTSLAVGSLAGMQKQQLRLRKELQKGLESKKDTKVALKCEPQTLDSKRQKLLRDRTDKSQSQNPFAKRSRPSNVNLAATSSMPYHISPQNYLNIHIKPYLMYSPATTPPRGALHLPPDTPPGYTRYVHPISLALNNPLYKTVLNARDLLTNPSVYNNT